MYRQPPEDRKVTIFRSATTLSYPAGFMLIVAMNPCPSGHATSTKFEDMFDEVMISMDLLEIAGSEFDWRQALAGSRFLNS